MPGCEGTRGDQKADMKHVCVRERENVISISIFLAGFHL